MAHLPEPVDDLDDPLPASDPVVRAPKSIVVLPEPVTYASRTVLGVAMAALLLGGSLGAVGVGIVYATQMRRPAAAGAPARGRTGRPGAPNERATASAFALEG